MKVLYFGIVLPICPTDSLRVYPNVDLRLGQNRTENKTTLPDAAMQPDTIQAAGT